MSPRQDLFNTRAFTGILLGDCNFGIFHSGITLLEDGEVPLHSVSIILWWVFWQMVCSCRLQVKNVAKSGVFLQIWT